MTERPGFHGYRRPDGRDRDAEPRAGGADRDLFVGRRRTGCRCHCADRHRRSSPGGMRTARAGHARDPRHAGRVLRPSQRRGRGRRRAWVRAGRRAVARRGGEATRQAGGDRGDPVRGRHRSHDRESDRHRAAVRRRACRAAARVVRRIGARPLAQVRRLGLHLRAWPRIRRSGASPTGWSRSAGRRCWERSPRSWARSTCWRRARRGPRRRRS